MVQQAFVTLIALLTEFRLRSGFEPAIEKFSQRNLGSLETAPQVSFAQHLGQIFLGTASGAVDRSVVVATTTRLAITAEKDADEPAAPATTDICPRRRGKDSPKSGTPAAHSQRANHCKISCLGERLSEGQSRNHRHPSFLAPIPKIPTGSTNRLDRAWMVTKDVLASLIISAAG
jgi:hypothetical protein